MIFGCQPSIIHTSVDIHIDIQAVISMQGHSTLDTRKKYSRVNIHVLWISVFNYQFFDGYSFGYLWISMDTHVLTCHGFSIQGLQRLQAVRRLFQHILKA